MSGPISEEHIKTNNFENVVVSLPVQSTLIIDPSQSSIAPSDHIAPFSSIQASAPKLVAPIVIGEMMIQANNNAINAILDSWLKNLEEQKKRIEEDLNASLSKPTPADIAAADAKNPNSSRQIYEDSLKQSLAITAGLENGLRNYTTRVHEGNSSAVQALSHFTPLFVAGIGAPGVLVAGMTGAREVVAPGVFEKIWQSAATIIPADPRIELGWIAALMGAGLITQTMSDGVFSFKPGTKPNQMDMAEARVFAKNVIALVQNPEINLFIQTMLIQQMDNGQKISEERKTQLTNMVKIVLISMAMALVYRTETGGITAQELEGMRNGSMVFEKGDVRGTLAGLLNDYLTGLDSKERQLVKSAVFDYLESKPPLDHLLQPGRVFRGVLRSLNGMAPFAA
jgi:hypothetical protein